MPNRRWDCKSARIAARRHRPVCGREILASTRAGAWGAAGEILKPAGWQWATRWCAKPGFGLEQGFDAIRCFNSNSQHSADALPRRSNHCCASRQVALRSTCRRGSIRGRAAEAFVCRVWGSGTILPPTTLSRCPRGSQRHCSCRTGAFPRVRLNLVANAADLWSRCCARSVRHFLANWGLFFAI